MEPALRFLIPSGIGIARSDLAVPFLGEWLTEHLGQPVEVTPAESYVAMTDALMGGAPVAAWAPPLVCARVAAHGGSAPLRLLRFGSDRFRSAIVQRRGETLNMNRLRVAWISPESTAGYLLPRAWMWRQGVVPQRMIFEEQFVGTYLAGLEALLAGRVDVAMIPANGPDGAQVPMLDLLAPTQRASVKVLLTTDAAPNDGIALSRAVPYAMAGALVDSLLRIVDRPLERDTFTRIFQGDRFVACSDGYQEMAHVVQAASGLVPRPSHETTETDWSEELKVATVVFADIVDFTASVNDLAPDLVHEFTNEAFAPLAEEVERRGGMVLKYIGDCVMAVFGVPRAHADDPLRAVDAALAMNHRLLALGRDFERNYGTRVAMRIGVHTGLVMVGAMGQSASADIVGSTVNITSRIQREAAPGEVLVGPSTARAIRGQVDLEEIGPRVLRGIDEPLTLHRAVGRRPEPTARHLTIPSFVHSEIRDAVLEAYVSSAEGIATLVRIQAPPSSPSSSFVDPLVDALSVVQPSPRVLRAALASADDLSEPPLAFMGRMLRAAANVTGSEGARPALMQRLAEWMDDPEAIETLVDVAAPPQSEESPATEDDTLQSELPRVAFVDWLVGLADEKPLVLVFTRVHRAGTHAINVLEKLLQRSVDRSVLIVLYEETETLRPLKHALPEIHLEVKPLTEATMTAVVEALLADVEGVPSTVHGEIVELAQGSADHASELVRLLYQTGAIRTDREKPVWSAKQLALPETARELLQVRVDRLTPEQKTILRAAAVVGHRFWRGVVHRLLGTAGALRTESTLDALVRVGMIRRHPLSRIAGEVEYHFRSRPLHDLVYRSLSRRFRESRHDQVARWLERRRSRFGVDRAAIAAHLEAAGLPERARPHHVGAARQAMTVGAYDQAARWFALAIEHWPERRTAELGALRWEYGVALTRSGALDEAVHVLESAAIELQQTGATDWETRAGLTLARARIAKAHGHQDELVALLETALAIVRPGALQHEILIDLAFAELTRGNLSGGLEYCDLAKVSHPRLKAKLADTRGALHLANGDLDSAESSFKSALSLREQSGATRLGRLNALVNLGAIAFAREQFYDAASRFGQALDIATVACWPRQMAMCRSNMGQALISSDRATAGIAQLERAYALSIRHELVDIQSDAARALATVLASSAPERAAVLAADALEQARQSGSKHLLDNARAVLDQLEA
jgi:class 3 adenylate cyclase/tetratricopeptide (TPR) repeat protein